MKDYRAQGAADFAAKEKDERLFHNVENPGRLYREGWHEARRAAVQNEVVNKAVAAAQKPFDDAKRADEKQTKPGQLDLF